MSAKLTNKSLIAMKIDIMVENGRKEIATKKQIEKYPIGSLVSYMNIDNVFRPGGFIIKFKPEYFIYIMSDFETKYKARYTHIQKMWVGSVYECKNDIISIVQSEKTKTKFPVLVNDIVVYYSPDAYNQKRFTYTEKYKKIIKWCDYFEK